ncbi:sirohydrochlorin chelatase [Effusibacillus dendaii]|uniref:Sirohydrochlorin cobaltochelatase n=1 Tax=Effusibacillus dendaii TaxID=2743772 RepID=A0A7I8D8S6_9BACL|nr:CbiX/SirB N-terminal domain-containing protein [Effusibacillus dendaii]BCJ85762.1 sirohydrochlorin cobaltochelatase [Effusibacillus dendaii]
MKTGIVLVAHGSREEAANRELQQVADWLAQANPSFMVQPAYLELAEPDIPTAIDRCAERGAERLVIVPFFLLAGSHVKEDIPRIASEAQDRYPAIPIKVAAPLGYHSALADIVADRIDDLLAAE